MSKSVESQGERARGEAPRCGKAIASGTSNGVCFRQIYACVTLGPARALPPQANFQFALGAESVLEGHRDGTSMFLQGTRTSAQRLTWRPMQAAAEPKTLVGAQTIYNHKPLGDEEKKALDRSSSPQEGSAWNQAGTWCVPPLGARRMLGRMAVFCG